jgi:hypothetical protein
MPRAPWFWVMTVLLWATTAAGQAPSLPERSAEEGGQGNQRIILEAAGIVEAAGIEAV